jgi:hypothetical protein
MLMVNIKLFFDQNLLESRKSIVRRASVKLGKGRICVDLVSSENCTFHFNTIRYGWPKGADYSAQDPFFPQLTHQAQ